MFGQVGRFCSDLDQKLRLLASSLELPLGASVGMVGKLEQRLTLEYLTFGYYRIRYCIFYNGRSTIHFNEYSVLSRI